MSGGHFCNSGYPYYQMSDFAYHLDLEIKNNNKKDQCQYERNFSPEMIDVLKRYSVEIRRLAGIMRAIDYLYAGDHDENSCLEEIKELEIEADPR